MSQSKLETWKVGHLGLVVVLQHKERPELNHLRCTVTSILEPSPLYERGAMVVTLHTDDKRLPKVATLALHNVMPVHQHRESYEGILEDPSKYFEVAEETGKGRGIRATRSVAAGTTFAMRGQGQKVIALQPAETGRRFQRHNYSGDSTPENVQVLPKKSSKLTRDAHTALLNFKSIIRNGIVVDANFSMVCQEGNRYNSELCLVGACAHCGPAVSTVAALKCVHLSMLDGPAKDPATALCIHFGFGKQRLQMVMMVAICCHVVQSAASIVMDNRDTPERTLKVRQQEYNTRRELWVEIVWREVFEFMSYSYQERFSTEEFFQILNPNFQNFQNCGKFALRTFQEDIAYLNLQARTASKQDKKRMLEKRSLLLARIQTVEAEMSASQKLREHSLRFDPAVQPVVTVALHNHWVSLVNGALHPKDVINVQIACNFRNNDCELQRPVQYPEDFERTFQVTQDIQANKFLCAAYNEGAVLAQGKGYFVNSGNSILEQVLCIPALLEVLKRFLQVHEKNMPGYLYDYLLLCSELATVEPEGPVPQPNPDLDYTPRAPWHTAPPAL